MSAKGLNRHYEMCRTESRAYPGSKQRNCKQIGDAADLFNNFNPMCDHYGLFRFSSWREQDIDDVDQHGQRKDHKPNPK